MTIWIRHGIVISPGENARVFSPGRVLIDTTRIARVEADNGDIPFEAAETIDASGCVVFPGQALLHTHFYSYPARGMPPLGKPARMFLDVLRRVWWPLDRALTLEAVGLAARLYLWELLRSGITCAFDHHASYTAIEGSLDEIANAFQKIGLRGSTCFEISERCGAKAADAAIEENIQFIRDKAPRYGLAPFIGLHASFTVSDNTLRRVQKLAEAFDVGVHVHLCEGKTDREITGSPPLRRFARFGFVNEKSVFVHGIDLRMNEMKLLANSGAALVMNPRSNLNNAVGFPDVANLKNAGVRLALGNDGFGANLCAEAQTAIGTFSTSAHDSSFGGGLLHDILFVNNPKIAGRHLGKTLGVIEPGATADIAIFPYQPPSPLDESNYFGHYLFGFGNVPARDVMIDGRLRLRDGAPVDFNPNEWTEKAREIYPTIWQQRSLGGFRVRKSV